MLRNSLALKLMFSSALILIITLGIFAYLNINHQKKHLIEEMRLSGVQISQTIKTDTLTCPGAFQASNMAC